MILEIKLKDIKEIMGMINDLNHNEEMKNITVNKVDDRYLITIEFLEDENDV